MITHQASIISKRALSESIRTHQRVRNSQRLFFLLVMSSQSHLPSVMYQISTGMRQSLLRMYTKHQVKISETSSNLIFQYFQISPIRQLFIKVPSFTECSISFLEKPIQPLHQSFLFTASFLEPRRGITSFLNCQLRTNIYHSQLELHGKQPAWR